MLPERRVFLFMVLSTPCDLYILERFISLAYWHPFILSILSDHACVCSHVNLLSLSSWQQEAGLLSSVRKALLGVEWAGMQSNVIVTIKCQSHPWYSIKYWVVLQILVNFHYTNNQKGAHNRDVRHPQLDIDVDISNSSEFAFIHRYLLIGGRLLSRGNLSRVVFLMDFTENHGNGWGNWNLVVLPRILLGGISLFSESLPFMIYWHLIWVLRSRLSIPPASAQWTLTSMGNIPYKHTCVCIRKKSWWRTWECKIFIMTFRPKLGLATKVHNSVCERGT